jgi:hypothetical protein
MNKYDYPLDPEQRLIVLAPRMDLVRQARDAWAKIEAAALEAGSMQDGGWKLRDACELDRQAFCQFIEAMFNLGAEVEPELLDLAGLKPVEQVIP